MRIVDRPQLRISRADYEVIKEFCKLITDMDTFAPDLTDEDRMTLLGGIADNEFEIYLPDRRAEIEIIVSEVLK